MIIAAAGQVLAVGAEGHAIDHAGLALEGQGFLAEWLQKTRHKQDEFGDVRYERLAMLYRFLELALRRRYPEECHRRANKLDCAFSRVFQCGEESLRKLRLELQRGLS
jgi:hypothetical protein